MIAGNAARLGYARLGKQPRRAIAALVCGCVLLHAVVDTSAAESPSTLYPEEDVALLTAGFLGAHPDLRHRMAALEFMQKGNFEEAHARFKMAARFADKPSQAMVAEMLWNGKGVQADRALAYAWMDLAAERGYKGFAILRERYWNALEVNERERAVVEGQAIYSEYGDSVAKPRIASALRRGRMRMAGSRTGTAGNTRIYVPGPSSMIEIDGSRFYHEQFWDAEKYQAWHDKIWKDPKVGNVTVGEFETIDPNKTQPDGDMQQEKPIPPVPPTPG